MARPRRSVQRVQANLKLDQRVHSQLVSQAADSGAKGVATYLEHVVSHAYRYDGPYLTKGILPPSLSLAKLRRRVKDISKHECPKASAGALEVTVRLDEPLAQMLQERARGIGVPYAKYLRAVLNTAADCTTPPSTDDAAPSSPEASTQPDLGIEIPAQAGEGVERRRAS